MERRVSALTSEEGEAYPIVHKDFHFSDLNRASHSGILLH